MASVGLPDEVGAVSSAETGPEFTIVNSYGPIFGWPPKSHAG